MFQVEGDNRLMYIKINEVYGLIHLWHQPIITYQNFIYRFFHSFRWNKLAESTDHVSLQLITLENLSTWSLNLKLEKFTQDFVQWDPAGEVKMSCSAKESA